MEQFAQLPMQPSLAQCPHCITETRVKVHSHKEPRYRCCSCRRTFSERYDTPLSRLKDDVEITDEMFIIPSETAEAFLQIREQLRQGETKTKKDEGSGSETGRKDVTGIGSSPGEGSDNDIEIIGPGPVLPIKKKTKAEWLGEILSQKWMNFYIKVLSKFAARYNLKLTSNLKISNPKGISEQKIEAMQAALRDLGLEDELEFNNE